MGNRRGEHYSPHTGGASFEFTRNLFIDPGPDCDNYYGYGLRRMGRRAEAMAAFQKAAALDRGDVGQAAEEALRRG